MRRLRLALVALACACSGDLAVGQTYPTRTITFVANYPPGGAVDITARIVGERLSKLVGQSVVVENRPGGTGAIGAAAVARAEPDGYTVLVTTNPAITFLPVLGQPTYDPLKDLKPVAKVAVAPTILVTLASSKYGTLGELMEAVHRPDNTILVGMTGVNSAPDIELKILSRLTKAKIGTVPYNGVAPVMNDVLGGHISAGAAAIPAVLQHILDGKMRGLAVISPSRSSILPHVPTAREAIGVDLDGFPTWYGFFLPSRAPADVVERLETGIRDVMKDAAVVERMSQLGYEVRFAGSNDFGRQNVAEVDLLRRAVRPE